MSKGIFIVEPNQGPEWLNYPHAFRRIVEQGIIHITPWHILEAAHALEQHRGLTQRYPTRDLFPFARRQDNDDVACWSRDSGEKVLIVHDFAAPGYENEGEFEDVWAWFRSAIEETILWG